jgi:threonine dehydrogenase-like Zn-dependent dehydrogenase
VEIVDAPLPRPERRQVRIRVEGCGLCGSNLPVWQGRSWLEYPFAPGAPGHEGWGRIDELGPGVENFSRGERVAFISDRAFAEYELADADQLVRLPAGQTIFPGEALGCAVNAFRRSGVHARQRVAVVGIGFIGALLVQLAARTGAQVLALSRRSFALDVARRSGAREVIVMDDQPAAVERVMELTGGAGCETVIEAAGAQAALDLASKLTRVRGRLVIAGYHQEARVVDMQLWNWRGLDVINAHERDPKKYVAGIQEAANDVAEKILEPAFLYTHHFKLAELPAAFAALEERPDGFLKALIRPGR